MEAQAAELLFCFLESLAAKGLSSACQVSPSPRLPCTGPALGFETWYEAGHLLRTGEEREDADTPTGLMTQVSLCSFSRLSFLCWGLWTVPHP